MDGWRREERIAIFPCRIHPGRQIEFMGAVTGGLSSAPAPTFPPVGLNHAPSNPNCLGWQPHPCTSLTLALSLTVHTLTCACAQTGLGSACGPCCPPPPPDPQSLVSPPPPPFTEQAPAGRRAPQSVCHQHRPHYPRSMRDTVPTSQLQTHGVGGGRCWVRSEPGTLGADSDQHWMSLRRKQNQHRGLPMSQSLRC